MPWTCQLRDPPTPEERKAGAVSVGDMWFAWSLVKDGQPVVPDFLSTTYVEKRMADRPPLMIRLPGGIDFCLDCRADCPGGEVGWQITGTLPNITVSPSLNVLGVWHGFLRDGVLSDDLNGRHSG